MSYIELPSTIAKNLEEVTRTIARTEETLKNMTPPGQYTTTEYTGYQLPRGTPLCIQIEKKEGLKKEKVSFFGLKKEMDAGEEPVVQALCEKLRPSLGDYTTIVWLMFGGGKENGDDIGSLPPFFYIYAVKVDGKYWKPEKIAILSSPQERIFTLAEFPSHKIELKLGISDEIQKFKQKDVIANVFGKEGDAESILYYPEFSYAFQRPAHWMIIS